MPTKQKPPQKFVPLWQKLTGIDPRTELEMDYDSREKGLRKLMKKLDEILQAEIPNACAERIKNSEAPRRARDYELTIPLAEHTFLWTPIPKACFILGIAQQRLSRYCKEATGMSLIEFHDKIQAKSVAAKMRAELQAFLIQTYYQNFPCPVMPKRRYMHLCHTEDNQWEFWLTLKANRIRPQWTPEIWAQSYGFPNYARFHRACVLCYGMSPHEMEFFLFRRVEHTYDDDRKEWVKTHPKKYDIHNLHRGELLAMMQKHDLDGSYREELMALNVVDATGRYTIYDGKEKPCDFDSIEKRAAEMREDHKKTQELYARAAKVTADTLGHPSERKW